MSKSSSTNCFIKTSFWIMLFGNNNSTISCINVSNQTFHIQWLQWKNINDSNVNVLRSQSFKSFNRLMNKNSTSNNTNWVILWFSHYFQFSKFEQFVIVVNDCNIRSSSSNEWWTLIIISYQLDCFFCRNSITWN